MALEALRLEPFLTALAGQQLPELGVLDGKIPPYPADTAAERAIVRLAILRMACA